MQKKHKKKTTKKRDYRSRRTTVLQDRQTSRSPKGNTSVYTGIHVQVAFWAFQRVLNVMWQIRWQVSQWKWTGKLFRSCKRHSDSKRCRIGCCSVIMNWSHCKLTTCVLPWEATSTATHSKEKPPEHQDLVLSSYNIAPQSYLEMICYICPWLWHERCWDKPVVFFHCSHSLSQIIIRRWEGFRLQSFVFILTLWGTPSTLTSIAHLR